MLPVTAGQQSTRYHMLTYTVLLTVIAMLPSLLGHSGPIYGVGAALLGGYFLFHAVRVLRSDEPKYAMAMFKYSILYLFLIFSLLLIDKMIDKSGTFAAF